MTKTRTPTDVADMEARWATIRLKLESNAEVLARQGTLVAKDARGRRVWVVRYVVMEGGRRVQKSIYIGGDDVPELIERARSLLEEYRRTGRWADEVERYARLAARAGGIARHMATGRGRTG
ncbi:MAG: hypothetical protein ABI353_07310 [Isosphaeraceae bacterium]